MSLLTLAAGGGLWVWLWGRWFSPGGAFLHGVIHLSLLAGCLFFLLRRGGRAGETHRPSLLAGIVFLSSAALFHNRIPTLMTAGLYASAVYWVFRASPAWREKPGPALWALLVLSLPVAPSLQFVFGYPLRALAARAAALLLPGAVKAAGCGLSDGRVEVFVDAPCAGAGMLLSALFLAAGASLAYRLGWVRTCVMLVLGLACALYANAVRAALLYLGTAGLIPVPLHRHEEATGLFCFAASALLLLGAAACLAKGGRAAREPEPPAPEGRPGFALTVAHALPCALFFVLSLSASEQASRQPMPLHAVVWPEAWEGSALTPCAPSPETEQFWSSFPGACGEFAIAPPGMAGAGGGAPDRLVLRLVTRPTRLLHPAEDCFRGAGFFVAPLPARKDAANRLWSAFIAERDGRKHVVRQCVIAVQGFDLRGVEHGGAAHAWPDVSSWYWDAARPGAEVSPLALAVTVVAMR